MTCQASLLTLWTCNQHSDGWEMVGGSAVKWQPKQRSQGGTLAWGLDQVPGEIIE